MYICEQEGGDGHDTQAVVMTKLIGGKVGVVGHVHWTITFVRSIVIRRAGSVLLQIDRKPKVLI